MRYDETDTPTEAAEKSVSVFLRRKKDCLRQKVDDR